MRRFVVECAIPETCALDNLRGVDAYNPEAMLGSWHMVAASLPDEHKLYQSFDIKFYYVTDHEIHFKINGKRK